MTNVPPMLRILHQILGGSIEPTYQADTVGSLPSMASMAVHLKVLLS